MSSAWHHIHGFERLSLCDWPGRSSCVIFLGGCNMRCPTCHNWQLAWEAEKLPVLARKDIEAYLNARRTWLDGIVITGGGGDARIRPRSFGGRPQGLWPAAEDRLQRAMP